MRGVRFGFRFIFGVSENRDLLFFFFGGGWGGSYNQGYLIVTVGRPVILTHREP